MSEWSVRRKSLRTSGQSGHQHAAGTPSYHDRLDHGTSAQVHQSVRTDAVGNNSFPAARWMPRFIQSASHHAGS